MTMKKSSPGMTFLRNFSRIVVGLVFIFSGFVKAVDPLGSQYKFQDYFSAFGMEWMSGMALVLGVLLCLAEFVMGFAFLFNVKMKFFSWLMLLFMLFFTGLTLWLAFSNPVSDCGCFGDAIVLTNWQTFYKNVVLMVFVLIVFFSRKKFKPGLSNLGQFVVTGLSVVILLGVSVYSYNHLPLIDFMPWKVGSRISEKVVPTPEIAEILLVYKHKETGQTYEYTSKTLPWKDTLFFNKLEFVDQKKKVIQEYKEAPIHDFIIDDINKENQTASIIGNPGWQFILVCYDIDKTNRDVFKKANEFYSNCLRDSIAFAALSGSSFEKIDYFRHGVSTEIPFYTVDETALKSVVRANPGLLLLKEGIVVDKWHYRDFPDWEDFISDKASYEKLVEKVKDRSGSAFHDAAKASSHIRLEQLKAGK